MKNTNVDDLIEGGSKGWHGELHKMKAPMGEEGNSVRLKYKLSGIQLAPATINMD